VCVEDDNLIKLLQEFYDDKGKRIMPESLIHSSMGFLKEFIKPILWGNKDEENKLRTYYRSHKELPVLLGLQRIFLRFGAFSRVKLQKSKSGNFSYHVIQMSGKDTNQVKNYDTLTQNGMDSWVKKGDYAMLMVEEVHTKEYSGKVYNFEVAEDNSYCAHGATLHNCSDFSSQRYSKAGKVVGEVKSYSQTKQKVDDLFLEYARLVDYIEPLVFIGENVDSLLDEDKRDYSDLFKEVFSKCGTWGYNVCLQKVNFANFGVPQNRVRTIILGIRNDLKMFPVIPTTASVPMVTTKDVIGDLIDSMEDMPMTANERNFARYIPKGANATFLYDLIDKGIPIHVYNHRRDCWDKPHYTLLQRTRAMHQLKARWLTVLEGKRIQTIPDDFILTGTTQQQWERVGRSVPPLGMYYLAKHIKETFLDEYFKYDVAASVSAPVVIGQPASRPKIFKNSIRFKELETEFDKLEDMYAGGNIDFNNPKYRDIYDEAEPFIMALNDKILGVVDKYDVSDVQSDIDRMIKCMENAIHCLAGGGVGH
jgi:DNA (cytosine-5)-methyltransferase 1